MERDYSIQQVAQLAGTTSRTLRYYDDIGLLTPSRIASNGYRHYDQACLVRLQQILLLRELGLSLAQITEILDRRERDLASEITALQSHLGLLHDEQHRLARKIAAVESTINALNGEEKVMAENMFDGFDHTQYREDVEERWGAKAYADADKWWRGMSDDERARWQSRFTDLTNDWIAAARADISPSSEEGQALARRHVDWLGRQGGAGSAGGSDIKAYVSGLADMYVTDPRFSAVYAISDGDTVGAEFVRDALRAFADAEL